MNGNGRFVTKLKTVKECSYCEKQMDIGETVEFERVSSPYKHFKIRHLECAIKSMEARLKENEMADAPDVILNDLKDVIEELKSAR